MVLKEHPRYFPTRKAMSDLSMVVGEWVDRHSEELSMLELLFALTDVTNSWAGTMVRCEREGEDDEKVEDDLL